MYKPNSNCCGKPILVATTNDGKEFKFDLGIECYRVVRMVSSQKWTNIVKQQKQNCLPIHICDSLQADKQTITTKL